jgi:hypothetical protein
MLFHVSEVAGIERFEPRPSQYAAEPVVWAIDADHLRNYLLPRECPRVTFYAGRETTVADVERLLGSSPAVIAVESAWLERLRSCRLYCYDLPAETFKCIDECAGYFVSRRPVVPAQREQLPAIVEWEVLSAEGVDASDDAASDGDGCSHDGADPTDSNQAGVRHRHPQGELGRVAA